MIVFSGVSMMDGQERFRLRAFVSLLSAFGFLLLAITGIILYVTPPGRIANWTNWTLGGLNKHQWIHLHICFSAVFLIVSVLHVWLNFKALASYFASKAKSALGLRKECILAMAIFGIVIWGALNPFIPFNFLLNLNDRIKFSWAVPQEQPPIPHAEVLSIQELAKQSDIEVEIVIKNLKEAGIDADFSDVFGDIAEQQDLSPNELFEIAAGIQDSLSGKHHGGDLKGSGFGHKTLKQACQEMGADIQKAIDTLENAGINAKPTMRIREIADNNGTHPSQIRQILENI